MNVLQLHHRLRHLVQLERILGELQILALADKTELALRSIDGKQFLDSYQGELSSHKLIICHKLDSRDIVLKEFCYQSCSSHRILVS